MKQARRFLIGVLFLLSVCFAVFAFASCEDEKPSANTAPAIEQDVGRNGEEEKEKLENKIVFKTLIVDGLKVTSAQSFSNATTEFSFVNEIECLGNVSYEVARDQYGENTFLTKVVPLNEGDNTFYVFENVDGKTNVYQITLRRRPMYTVEFNEDGGGIVQDQMVEEGSFASMPEMTKLGYNFVCWDYDFTQAITCNITTNAKWEVADEMKKIEFTSTATTCLITGIKDKTVTEIVMPDYVTSIGDYAFNCCRSLNSVTIGNSVTSIGYCAFFGCNNLTNVVIGKRVTSIANGAFSDCSSLTNIYIMDIVAWCNISGLNNLMSSYGSSDYKFYLNNELVTELIIPNGVKTIGDSAFAYCSNLASIEIPDSVTSIGGGAFRGCSSLTNIEIPNSVTSIGGGAFRGCSSLTNIEIPNSVTSIGSFAFYGCVGLTIYCKEEIQPSGWGSDWNSLNCPVVWDCDNNDIADNGYIYTVVESVRYAIKENVAIVARQASNIQKANIPTGINYKNTIYSVTCIGERAFFYCGDLMCVIIPDSVTSIGDSAFAYCGNLKIYCEATSKPSGWDSDWNFSNRPVVWGYTGE